MLAVHLCTPAARGAAYSTPARRHARKGHDRLLTKEMKQGAIRKVKEKGSTLSQGAAVLDAAEEARDNDIAVGAGVRGCRAVGAANLRPLLRLVRHAPMDRVAARPCVLRQVANKGGSATNPGINSQMLQRKDMMTLRLGRAQCRD